MVHYRQFCTWYHHSCSCCRRPRTEICWCTLPFAVILDSSQQQPIKTVIICIVFKLFFYVPSSTCSYFALIPFFPIPISSYIDYKKRSNHLVGYPLRLTISSIWLRLLYAMITAQLLDNVEELCQISAISHSLVVVVAVLIKFVNYNIAHHLSTNWRNRWLMQFSQLLVSSSSSKYLFPITSQFSTLFNRFFRIHVSDIAALAVRLLSWLFILFQLFLD